jgi:hypothetical protein
LKSPFHARQSFFLRSAEDLLVDKDELIADSLRQYLVTNGCEVDVAQDAASAKGA